MHEVEVKAHLKDKEKVIARLAELGCALGPKIFQDDTIYVRQVGSVEQFLKNTDFLRLRVEDSDRTLFTFKRNLVRAEDPDSAPLEFECAVDSRNTMEQILNLMGYSEAIRVRKHRRKGKHENWEICIDEVEEVGSFIEVEELLAPEDDAAASQARMRAFMTELGIPSEDQSADRYDLLLLRLKKP